MRRTLAAVLAALTLVGCSSSPSDVATDDGPATPPVPEPSGEVRTAQLATVIDAGEGVQLCLGPIAQSYPPQCGGPDVTGWDWSGIGQLHDQQGAVTWGSYAVTGRWDGSSLAASSAVPAALYDPAMVPPLEPPDATWSEAELTRVAAELQEELPDVVLGAAPVEGQVLAEVYYDDGSLQAWCDATYGDGAVAVTPYLVDAA
jgi:hypothetical protein